MGLKVCVQTCEAGLKVWMQTCEGRLKVCAQTCEAGLKVCAKTCEAGLKKFASKFAPLDTHASICRQLHSNLRESCEGG